MKLQTFIFNWNRVDAEVEKMYAQLQEAGIDATVINSTDNERDGWLNVGDDYWCYGQTYTAFNNFDYDNDWKPRAEPVIEKEHSIDYINKNFKRNVF